MLGVNTDFVFIDIKKSIEEQGEFDLIIHKLSGKFFRTEEENPMKRFVSYLETHKNVICVDPVQNVAVTWDRVKTTPLMNSIFFQKGEIFL